MPVAKRVLCFGARANPDVIGRISMDVAGIDYLVALERTTCTTCQPTRGKKAKRRNIP